jgi:hypothetical protein
MSPTAEIRDDRFTSTRDVQPFSTDCPQWVETDRAD